MNIYYLGFLETANKTIAANYCIVYAKQYIYLAKLKNKNKNKHFNVDFLTLQILIYIKNGKNYI